MAAPSRTRRLANIRRNAHAPCFKDGHHLAGIAGQPRKSRDSVEVDFRCADCGGLVKTISWTRAAWDEAVDAKR